jgi:hypothetical protein
MKYGDRMITYDHDSCCSVYRRTWCRGRAAVHARDVVLIIRTDNPERG